MTLLNRSLLLILPLALLAGGWYFISHKDSALPEPDSPTAALSPAESTIADHVNNPLATKSAAEPIVDGIANETETTAINGGLETETVRQSDSSNDANDVDVTSVAVNPLSDEEFIKLETQMRNNRELRADLATEFRYNTDPVRAKQLAALLGDYDDPEILLAAAELTHSGEPQSQKAGLNLLRLLQPRNTEARDIAIDLLSSENDPAVLVSTMNVLATPASDATPNQRQLIADNIGSLSTHYDAKVRSHSLALMGRWDKNSPAAKEALTRGLTDSDATVRARAANALRNVQVPNDQMINGLLTLAENSKEKKTTRFSALRTLEKMELSAVAKRRFRVAKTAVNRRQVSRGN